MFCIGCGRKQGAEHRFCAGCGRSLAGAEPTPPAEVGGDAIPGRLSASLREIILLDKITGAEIVKSPVFRFLCLVAVVPLALQVLESNAAILNGLAIWSGVLWCLLLYRLFSERDLSFSWAIGTVFFTCFVGLPVLQLYLWLPPQVGDRLIASGWLPYEFLGYLVVGLREEVCKGAPLLPIAVLTTQMRRPVNGLVLGMMSGVGFAAAENVYYVYQSLDGALEASRSTGATAYLVMPIYSNVVRMAMTPFLHGSFSGILGYFVSLAVLDRVRRTSLIVAGLGLATVLHAFYDTLVGHSPLLGVAVEAGTFFLLMTYIVKGRGLTSARDIGGGVFRRTVMFQVPEGLRAGPSRAGAERAPETDRRPPSVVRVEETETAAWSLCGLRGPAEGRVYPLEGEVRVGRDPERCAIHLVESSVSREHARIVSNGAGGPVRVSRLSRNAPLFVNGEEVEERELLLGDQLQIGSSVFCLVGRRRDV